MRGRKFTYFNENGNKHNKIDRVLVCHEFLTEWPVACLRAMPRFLSDHCPLILTCSDKNFGPKPFRVFNSWLERKDFDEVGIKTCGNFVGDGEPDVLLMKKLKEIKESIKIWKKEVLSKKGETEIMLKEELEILDVLSEDRALSEEEEWAKIECLKDLKEIESYKSKILNKEPECLSELDAASLMVPFSKEEIKYVVFECGSDKAPGPDGFDFKFIKSKGSISVGCSSSFITLIPKNKDPVGLKEYRPINLIEVISKTIYKILENRLKVVIGSIITENQTAYDNVNWSFLLDIMRQMGFLALWCKWIKGILVLARSSVLLNGSPTLEFNCSKEVRQGDPLSPFLFLLVMEGLSNILDKARCEGLLKGIQTSNNGPAPVGVIKNLEAKMRKFLWVGSSSVNKMNWVAWDWVTWPKNKRGLGINRLIEVNEALLVKWGWRYTVENHNLWCKVVEACHGKVNHWSFLPVNGNIAGCWKNVFKFGRVTERLEVDQGNGGFKWQWSRQPESEEELKEWQKCMKVLSPVRLSSDKDKLYRFDDNQDGFSVKSVKKTLIKERDTCHPPNFIWCK
ncbi:uncharacterized protein LOC110893032 [Helianthus annuus]|uniref:uncharacterized protein LOC110893032 n=1 Tax=Helianthus annuus TaxID=4232 RepID=UPI000B9090FD|nr:uncharacterized protein LOC110893032 [Helianthus annuus]